MQEVFEKIIEKLEKLSEESCGSLFANEDDDHYEIYQNGVSDGYEKSAQIVRQVAVEYNNGWIPVESGLLPNKTKEYLVTMVNSDEKSTMYSVCHEIYYTSTKEWDCDRDEDNDWKVIAWKEKDKPYQFKKEERKNNETI